MANEQLNWDEKAAHDYVLKNYKRNNKHKKLLTNAYSFNRCKKRDRSYRACLNLFMVGRNKS